MQLDLNLSLVVGDMVRHKNTGEILRVYRSAGEAVVTCERIDEPKENI